jgi:hypothetical protein
MKLIEIIIGPAGETHLQTQGFQGSKCKASSAALEQALGLVTQEQRTTEYYLGTESQVHQQSRDGT